MTQSGLHVAEDTGAPAGAASYKTLVLLHGLGFHSRIFTRLSAFASAKSCRLILINRRDFPGAEPLSSDALRQLQAAQVDTDEGKRAIRQFMRDRAYEVFTLLKVLIVKQHIPASDGIILVGWSLGSLWMTAFLTHAPMFPVEEIDIAPYIRRVVTYDPPYRAFGLAPHQPALFMPLEDPAILEADIPAVFGPWVTGYFEHQFSDPPRFEDRVLLTNPPSTLTNLNLEDVMATNPVSDVLLYSALLSGYIGRTLFEGALYQNERQGSGWNAIEWRYLWCDRSVWVCAYGAYMVRKELEQMKIRRARPTRNVVMVRWHGANHFPHWDSPQQMLDALLRDADDDVKFT